MFQPQERGPETRESGRFDTQKGTDSNQLALFSSTKETLPGHNPEGSGGGATPPGDPERASSVFNHWTDARPVDSPLRGARPPAESRLELPASAPNDVQGAWDFESPWKRLEWGNSNKPATDKPVAGGAPLPQIDCLQRSFGQHDLSGVRVHTDDHADTKARALGTEAVTVGRDIFFQKGAFDPNSRHGKEVLGHELAHVVQQQGQSPAAQTVVPVGERGTNLEKEAVRAGAAVVNGVQPVIELKSAGSVAQRFESDEHAELGDNTRANILAADGVKLNPEDLARLNKDSDPAAGGGKFGPGQRSLSLDLRVRNSQDNLPTMAKQTVPVSYGEMLALSGDLYYSMDNMKLAPADEVLAVRNLVAEQKANPTGKDYDVEFQRATAWRQEGIYQPGTGVTEGSKAQFWGMSPPDNEHAPGTDQQDHSSYIELAGGNSAHFAPATGTQVDNTSTAPEGNAAQDNHQAFTTDHNRAIQIAQKVREIKKSLGLMPGANSTTTETKPNGAELPAGQNPAQEHKLAGSDAKPMGPAAGGVVGAPGQDWRALENEAYLYNASGDHYLTDAFSAGHQIDPKALAAVTDRVLNDATFYKIVDDMAPYAMKDHSINWTKWLFGVGFGLQAWVVKPKLRKALSIFKQDLGKKHSVGIKLVHDWLNENGVQVQSKNGKFHWKTMGDGHIDPVTKDIASRAVLASRNYIRALMSDSDSDLAKPENADDAWAYTPNVDASDYAGKCEAGMRYMLSKSDYLWNLLKKAQTTLDEQEGQNKVEKKTKEFAKQDKGGDWGKQPSNSRFTRRATITTHP